MKMDEIPAVSRAKGSNLTGLLYALEQRFGAETVARVLAAVPPELGQALQGGGAWWCRTGTRWSGTSCCTRRPSR